MHKGKHKTISTGKTKPFHDLKLAPSRRSTQEEASKIYFIFFGALEQKLWILEISNIY